MATEPVSRSDEREPFSTLERTSITVVLGHKTAREIRFEGKTPYAFEILMKLDEMLTPEMLEKVGLPEDVNEMVLKRKGIEMEIFTEVNDGDVIYTESRAENTRPSMDADECGLTLLMRLSEEEEKTSGPKVAEFLKKITKLRKNLADPLLGPQDVRSRLAPAPRPRGQEVGAAPTSSYQPPSYHRAFPTTPTGDEPKSLAATFEDSKSCEETEQLFPAECQKSPFSLDVSTERGSGRFPAEMFKSCGSGKFLTDSALLSDDSSQPGSSKTDEDKDIDVLDRIPELPRGSIRSGPLSALHSSSDTDETDEELGSPSSTTGPSGKGKDSIDPHILHAQKILDDDNPEIQICKLLMRERQAKQDKRFLGNKLQQHRGLIEDLRRENQKLLKENLELRDLREENQRLDTSLFAVQCDSEKQKKQLGRMMENLSKSRKEGAVLRRDNLMLQEKNELMEKRVKELQGENGVKVMGVMLPRHMPSEVNLLETAFKAVSSLKKKLQERQLEILKSQITCSICWDAERATALIPCGHCFCNPCALRVQICPICRKHIRHRQKLYY